MGSFPDRLFPLILGFDETLGGLHVLLVQVFTLETLSVQTQIFQFFQARVMGMFRGSRLLPFLLRIIDFYLIVLVNRSLFRNLLKFFLKEAGLFLVVFLLLFQFLESFLGAQSLLL